MVLNAEKQIVPWKCSANKDSILWGVKRVGSVSGKLPTYPSPRQHYILLLTQGKMFP